IQNKFNAEYNKLNGKVELERKIEGLLLWAKQSLGYQVSLHAANSSLLDSDQLAWCLGIFCRFGQSTYHANMVDQHFLRFGFKCLFSTQSEVGTWRHYQPLFHYSASGNAYCQPFETFAMLTAIALRDDAEFLRRTLKGYFKQLLGLYEYAVNTAIPLKGS